MRPTRIRDNNMITFIEAEEVLRYLPYEFDSHAFIYKYIDLHENDYIDELAQNNGRDNVFRKVNAEIGRFLSIYHEELNIEKFNRQPSQNIKGNYTENQNWIKK